VGGIDRAFDLGYFQKITGFSPKTFYSTNIMTTNLLEEEQQIDSQFTNSKRIEELLEDAEIEAEIEAEKRIRSKNTRIIAISIVSVVVLIVLYTGIRGSTGPETNEVTKVVRAPLETNSVIPPALGGNKAGSSTKPEKTTTNAVAKNDQVAAVPSKSVTPKALPPVKKLKATNTSKPSKAKPTAKLSKPTPAKAVAAPSKPVVKSNPVKKAPSKTISKAPVVAAASPTGTYFVQIGAFSVRENADNKVNDLKSQGFFPSIREKTSGQSSYNVVIGGFTSVTSANTQMGGLKSSGFSPKLGKNSDGTYSIILGSYNSSADAMDLQDSLSDRGYISSMKSGSGQKSIYIVQVGGFSSEGKAKAIQKVLDKSGYNNTFIRKKV
jgi:cell division protein FtsN